MNHREAELTLRSGRRIQLLALDQSLTYEGLLLGVPTRELNRRMMDHLIASHADPNGYGGPYLIEPEQRPLEVPPRHPVNGTPASLPGITCIARFMSNAIRRDPDCIWSVLRVIWYQEDFAFPIDQVVLERLSVIDWEAHASGWEP